METLSANEDKAASGPLASPKPEEKPDNPFPAIILNIILPAIIWSKFSNNDYLGPTRGFLVALACPLSYGIFELARRRKFNPLSILGFVSVLLTGGIGLLKLDNHWYAIKEAAIPGTIGLVVLGSLRTKFPLVRKMIYNEKIIQIDRVDAALKEHNNERAFERLLIHASCLLSCSFFLSAVLNFTLARIIVIGTPGTVEYNAQLGRMTALAYPVIVLPSMIVMLLAMWFLFRGIKRLTGLDLESVLKGK